MTSPEKAILIVSTYELLASSSSYFIELKLRPHTIERPIISMPSDRQANEMGVLYFYQPLHYPIE